MPLLKIPGCAATLRRCTWWQRANLCSQLTCTLSPGLRAHQCRTPSPLWRTQWVRTTLYPVAAGQPLLDHDLTPRGAGPGLAGRIPNGMRALAIKSDEVVGVGGFLSPGLHVDMLVTLHTDDGAQTTTVLQDAEVVAVGQQTEPDPSGKAVTATVVTLLLTPDQVQRALLSGSQGSVNFVLRNSTDRASTHSVPGHHGRSGHSHNSQPYERAAANRDPA